MQKQKYMFGKWVAQKGVSLNENYCSANLILIVLYSQLKEKDLLKMSRGCPLVPYI